MREDLAREFPEALRVAAWSRLWLSRRAPMVSRETVLWAVVSGIGAGFIVSAIGQALLSVTLRVLDAFGVRMGSLTLAPFIEIAGGMTTVAVTLTAGGRLAVVLFLIYVAIGFAAGIPAFMTFCERSGLLGAPGVVDCTPAGYLIARWPLYVGIALGIAASRAVVSRGVGVNALLRIAGTYALVTVVLNHVWSASIAYSTNALTSGLTFTAGIVGAAVAAGVVAAQLPRGTRSAAIVAAVTLLPWLTWQLPLALQSLAPTLSEEYRTYIILSIVGQPIAAAFLVLSAAVAARSRFMPRGAA